MLQTVVSSLSMFIISGFGQVTADPSRANTPPKVTLDHATVTGFTSGSINKFLGIPFAKPPTGNLRFQLPKQLPPYTTNFSATEYGPACPQPLMKASSGLTDILPVSTHSAEDCLTLNVVTPNTATPTAELPVLVWIFGGGFKGGGTSLYESIFIMDKAILLELPVIYVSMNYRVNAFGFLGGKEVKDAGVGNLGLHDQRLALKWIQRYISAFGGDPAKVTLWGESAGAMSVALQMVTNGGNVDGLFRAAIMNSGATIPTGDITEGQPYYDAIVTGTGCSDTTDTLQCLREVPYETLLVAVNQSSGLHEHQSNAIPWWPRVDGVFLTADPRHLVRQGSVANIPFISSNCDDEGTIFSFLANPLGITTDSQFEQSIRSSLIPNASTVELTQLMTYYPSDPALGSPFDTGDNNALTPQFKRIAAFQGDFFFQAPRRFLIQNRSRNQNIWTYLYKRGKRIPYVGAFHGIDLFNIYTGGDIVPYFLRFVTYLDPNGSGGAGTSLYWPRYDATTNQTVLEFLDGLVPLALTTDTYRAQAIAYMTNVSLAHPL